MRTPRLATAAWITISTVVLLYAPMAFEYTARLFGGGPELWNHTFSAAIGSEHALGTGSIHHEQQDVYAEYRWVLLTHTTLAAVAVALAVFQLTKRSRRRPGVHRITGRLQATLAVVAMLGAMTYLVLVGPRDTFDGPAFYLQLWGLALGTVLGTVLGVLAARHGQIAMHRVLMTYAFALLCTAPFLRVLYVVLGLAWPNATQEVTNLAGGSIETVWAPMAAILASRTFATSARRDHLRALPGRRLESTALVAAGLGLTVLVAGYVTTFDGIDRVTLSAVAAWTLGFALVAVNHRSADGAIASEEWRIHHAAMLASLPVTAVLWGAYALAFSMPEAFFGALLTGPALALTLGLFLVAWRRRRPARVASPAVATLG
jgi:uncharacterized membrane protein YozB (DUF420 family)